MYHNKINKMDQKIKKTFAEQNKMVHNKNCAKI